MPYLIVNGEVLYGKLYLVAGEQSVVYNTVTYNPGQTFRGVYGVKTFMYTGTGTQILNELLELKGINIDYEEITDNHTMFTDISIVNGIAIEYELNDSEKSLQETTKIQGFAIELINYPFYAFEITEVRL